MTDGVRRVVTGVDEAGKAVFISDDSVEIVGFSNSPPGTGIGKVWGSNGPATVPTTDATFDYDTVYPPAPGFRFQYWRVMPDSARDGVAPLDPEVMGEEMDSKFPGLREHIEPGGTGMHTTPTVDIGFVVEGEIWLELDDGAERLLRAGDIYVQNGTRHAWHNRSDEVCTIAIALIGAEAES